MEPATLTTTTAVKTRRLLQSFRRHKVSYLFVAPYMILFSVFTVIPVIVSIALSFTSYNMLEPPKWLGTDNYLRLFLTDDIFLIAVKNTFIFAAVTGPVSYIACLLLAWFINELSPKVRAILVVLFYAPSISGNVYLVWQVMFSSDSYGFVNGFLIRMGFIRDPVQWMQDPDYMLPVIILVALWLSLGTSFLVFIAGLQGVDTSLYEAGAIDGIRNRWQELWYITLPVIRPQLMFGAVISVTQSFAVSDITVALAGFPSVQYAAHTVVTHLMDYGSIRFELGYASAIATILFAVMVGTNKGVQRILKKVGE